MGSLYDEKFSLGFWFLAVIVALSTPAHGQNASDDVIEELVVTAQYREQSVQDVPIAMSAFSDEDIVRAGITDLQGIAKLAPDFTAVNDLGAVRLSIRGIQSNSNDETADQALTFNIDGDYINRPEFINAALFDLERVEVLRGPQGTLYGRNATGGAVNAIAAKPSLDGIEGRVSADFGDYSALVFNGAINFPLGEKAAVRIAVMNAEHDGYSEHPNFSFDTHNQDVQAARIGLLVEPNDIVSIYLAAEQSESTYNASYASINVNNPGFEVDGPPPGTGTCDAAGWVTVADFNPGFGCAPYNTNYLDRVIDRDNYVNGSPLERGFRDIESTAFRGQVDVDLDSWSITYRFAMRDSELLGNDPLPGLVFYRDSEVDNTTHELRFSGGDDDGLFWQAGLFIYEEQLDFFGGLHLPFGGAMDPQGFGIWLNTFYRPDFDSDSQAAFGQVEIPFNDVLTAVLGVRVTEDDKFGTFYNFAGPPAFAPGGFANLRPITAANVVLPQGLDNTETTWTAGLNFTPNDSSLHYGKISKGYKAGGFDAVGPYGSEEVIAYEFGSKNQLDGYKLNANAYYYDYTDLQASVLLNTAVGAQIFNAGEAEIYGFEAQYEKDIGDSGLLGLTATYTSAEFDEFAPLEEAVQCVGNPGCAGINTIPSDASGNTMPNTPDWILSVSYDHVWDLTSGELIGSIFTRYKSDYYNTVFNYADDEQDAYTQTDLSLEWLSDSGSWSIMGYVRNLEDERPISYATFISAGPGNDDFNWIFGAPRTYGVKVGYSF